MVIILSLRPSYVTSVCVFQLASVDVMGALDMYMERGQWEKCLETAEQQVCTCSLIVTSLVGSFGSLSTCQTNKSCSILV